MTTTASGCITKAEQALKNSLAACTTFQSWVGESTATGAAEHIYLEAVPPADVWSDAYEMQRIIGRRPFAQIWTSDTQGITLERIARPSTVVARGTLMLRLEQNVSSSIAHDYAEVDRQFKNTIGAILQSGDSDNPGLAELLATAGYLDWNMAAVQYWTRTDRDEVPTMGDAQMCEIQVDWGTSE